MVIIQAGLANRHDARVLRQLAQRRDHVVLRLLNVARMNANRRINSRILFREFDRTPAALDGCADCDDAFYICLLRAPEHILEIICEIGKIEMCVSVD
jgi:hypothetical protein